MWPKRRIFDYKISDFISWPKNLIFDILIEADRENFFRWLNLELDFLFGTLTDEINKSGVFDLDEDHFIVFNSEVLENNNHQDALFTFEIYATECSIKYVDVDNERIPVTIGYIDFRIVGPNRLQVSGRIYQPNEGQVFFLQVYKSIISVYPLIKDNSPAIIQNQKNQESDPDFISTEQVTSIVNIHEPPTIEYLIGIFTATGPSNATYHPKVEQDIEEWIKARPEFPAHPESDVIEEWFYYYHIGKLARHRFKRIKKYTLEQLAKDKHDSHDSIKKLHPDCIYCHPIKHYH